LIARGLTGVGSKMRVPIVVAVVLVAAIAIFLIRTRSSAADSEAPARRPAEVTEQLRARILHGTAAQFAIEPVSSVWGVLMETGYPEAAATLVALGDGTASLYFSSGGGIIGGGPHPSVRAAALRLVGLAGSHLTKMSPVSEFPLPASGEVKFYVLTTNGVVAASAREEHLGAGGHPLSELFFAGHEVITGLREVSQERER
jgi:hypothetical protein